MTKEEFWAEYTPAERSRFIFHTAVAVCCLPLYILLPAQFQLLISPYLFFLAVRPKSECLLPIILHCLYGSQQRFVFILGCFTYVLFNFMKLRRYSLHWLFLFYMMLMPYFAWFFYQKLGMPRFVPGIGDMVGGLFSHLVFSCAFWAALVVKKTGRPFFRGMVVWAFVLLVVMSAVGGGTGIDTDGSVRSRTIFSRCIFWAIPFLSATLSYLIASRRKDYGPEKCLAAFGCFVIILDFFHLTKCDVTFTQLGLCVLSSVISWVYVRWRKAIAKWLSPLPLFVISNVIVLLSPQLVEKYGGLYKSEGDYSDMSMTSFDSLMKKIQRKTVDDRAEMWALTIKYIRNDILRNPIWVKPTPYMEVEVESRKGSWTAYFTVASHNTMLNLIRFYGFYGGFGLYILYLWFFCRWRNRDFMLRNKHSPLVVVMAVCIAEGVVGGHTGHYVVNFEFGPLLFVSLGACWGVDYWSRRNPRCANPVLVEWRR